MKPTSRVFANVVIFALANIGANAQPAASIHPAPGAPKKSFTPASVHALPGLQCKLYPTGSDASLGLAVFTDDDGYARFHAVRVAAGDAVQSLTMDCTDSEGRFSTYSVDLTADETFAPRPLNIANERGTNRPALKGDPLGYTQSELIQAGYGLRPDPVKDAAAYSRWLAAASLPGRLLEAKRPSPHSHSVVTEKLGAWAGSVLAGAPNYISVTATCNVPKAIPGGDETSAGTAISIWDGLGGFNTGAGLWFCNAHYALTHLNLLYQRLLLIDLPRVIDYPRDA